MKRGLSSSRSAQDTVRWFVVMDGIDVYVPRELEQSALFTVEHSNPENWKKKFFCTAEDGFCYGCQMAWEPKTRLYLNVWNGSDTAIYSEVMRDKSIGQQLIDYFAIHGTITDTWFNISMKKRGRGYSYKVVPNPDLAIPLVPDNKLIKLDNQVNRIAYENQKQYLN
jgi:hypothetical protein